MAVPETPIVEQIVASLVDGLEATNKRVGEADGFHFATDRVVRAPGVSSTWFDDTTWEHLYWVVVPEETSSPGAAQHFDSILEVFVVGAKRGHWTDDQKESNLQLPLREQVQYKIAADIKKAVTENFRRNGLADNTDITSTRYSFFFWPKFAIVTTRWEIEFTWPKSRP